MWTYSSPELYDLLVIRRGEKVVVEVQIVVTGDAAPGSLVTQELNTLEVEADVSSIPEQIEVSVEDAEIGTQILAGSITLPANTTLRGDAEQLVVNVVTAPSEAALEAEVDTVGAGVVEEAPQTSEAESTESSGD